jgi:hypothetical protein
MADHLAGSQSNLATKVLLYEVNTTVKEQTCSPDELLQE